MNNIGIGIVRAETEASSFLTNLYDYCMCHVSCQAITAHVDSVGNAHTEEIIGGPVYTFIRKQVNIINVKASRVNKDSA